MILWVCALALEAQAVAKYFNLKLQAQKPWSHWQGENMALVQSGVGESAAAAATSFLLSQYPTTQYIVNYGLAASPDLIQDELYLVRAIQSPQGRRFYPDLWQNYEKKADLKTFLSVQTNLELGLTDMEASGFYLASSHYLGPQQISVWKVVSDRGEGKIDLSHYQNVLYSALAVVAKYLPPDLGEKIDRPWQKAMDYCLNQQSFSVTQTRSLLELWHILWVQKGESAFWEWQKHWQWDKTPSKLQAKRLLNSLEEIMSKL
ncbi:MAG TPA: hypothetical protein PLQ36_03935 [Candidatus Gracilibacteria bacterium]|nr:hypothetical protein [Candidatus Gracilibacteria bacterium]